MRRIYVLLLLLTACAEATPTPAPVLPTVTLTPVAQATQMDGATPTPQAPTAAPTATPELAATTEPTPEPAIQPELSVLPFPLLLLADPDQTGVSQIWRLDTDGVTLGPLTAASSGVTGFAVSPVDGRIAYVSDNDLLLMNADGSAVSVLVDGPAPDPNRIEPEHNAVLSQPLWAPDGSRIAFAYGGVAVVDLAGGAPQVLLANEPQEDPGLAAIFPLKTLYFPAQWAPDGQRLAVSVGYVPEGTGLLVMDLAGATTQLISPDGPACCDPQWAPDGQSLVFASAAAAIVPAGLWRADAATGAVERLVAPITPDGPMALASNAVPLDATTVRTFFIEGQSIDIFAAPLAFTIYDIAADGALTQLQTTPHTVSAALWFPDRTAAVVMAASPTGVVSEGAVVHARELPDQPLPLVGTNLAWGR